MFWCKLCDFYYLREEQYYVDRDNELGDDGGDDDDGVGVGYHQQYSLDQLTITRDKRKDDEDENGTPEKGKTGVGEEEKVGE